MRSGWCEVALGDICRVVVTRRHANEVPTLPYVGLEHMQSGSPEIDRYGTAAGLASQVVAFERNDVLFGRLRPYLKKVAMARVAGVCSPEILVLRAMPKVADPGYLCALASSELVIDWAVSASAGSRMPRTAAADLMSFRVPLPTLVEQRRIVDLIGSAIDASSLAKSTARHAALSRQAIERRIVESGDATLRRLGDVAMVAQGSSLPLSLQGSETGTTPWFKIMDMTSDGNEYGYRTAATMVNDATLQRHHARVWPAGSVVFPRVGAAVVTEKKRRLDIPGACDENHIVVVPGDALIPSYLLAVLEHVRLSSLVRSGAVPSLNQNLIRDLTIPVPPLVIQQRQGAATDSLRSVEETTNRLAKGIERLRAALVADLLFGDHEIPEAYDRFLGVAA